MVKDYSVRVVHIIKYWKYEDGILQMNYFSKN